MSTMTNAAARPPRVQPGRERLVSRPFLSGPFLAVTGATLLFFVYVGMVQVVVPRFVEDELDAGEFGIGLSLAAFAAAAIAIRPMIGRAGDAYGRRRLMMAGAVIAALAGAATGLAGSLWQLLVLRALMGIGEAGLFVGAVTMVADLSPPHRRAEAASYFSVAVFAGLGVGPVLGEWILDDTRYALTFATAGVFAVAAGAFVFVVPRRVDRRVAGPRTSGHRFLHPVAVWPGVVLASGIAAFASFSAFIPDHARTVGLPGAGGLFLVYSVVCLVLRVAGARLPERLGPGRSVTIAFVTVAIGLVLLAAVTEPWGLWVAAGVIGVGMAFLYPSLMALVVNNVGEDERASALSSFTMFFEAGTIVGGLALGGVGELFGKRAGFLGGAVLCAVGLVVLWSRVASPRDEHVPLAATFIPVAGD
jgi:MFS family permease